MTCGPIMTTAQPPKPIRPRGYRRHDGGGDLHVLDEPLFASVLARERKRTDRSNRSLILLLAAVGDGPRACASSLWRPVIAALGASAGDADVLGWFDQRRAIGLIVTDLRPADVANACDALDARVRRELAKRLHTDHLAGISIRLHVHPAYSGAAEHGPRTVEPLPCPDRRCAGPRDTIAHAVKRAVDVVLSVTLLLMLSPLLMLIAALVKLRSRGPAFYRQMRIGYMAKPFTMLKFRTMYLNADHQLHLEFVGAFISGGALPKATNGVFKLADDPRVTPLGRFLRTTSLDELPQLWNVLRGDMSLVGPRPPLPYEVAQYRRWHRRRLVDARPGLTGLWQVTGRSRTTFDEMVRLDLRYARQRSFWTDLKILLATPRAVISGKGAT